MTKIHVNGVTHYTRARNLACGIRVHNRSLDSVLKMYIEATEREVDCMACIAEESGSEG